MSIKYILLASTAIIGLSAPAFSADKETYETKTKIERDSNGNYSNKDTVKSTNSNGTDTSSEKKLSVEVDSKGNTTKSTTTKNVTDPKGLGNKHTVKTKDTEKTKDGQLTTTHSKTVDGKTVEGTKDSYKTESKTKSDAEGNYEEKDKTTNTDSSGTTTKFEKNANVDVDAKGNVEKTTTTKEVTDPKGLGNKHTVTTSNKEKVKDGAVEKSQEMKVDGKTVESTTETSPKK